MKKTLSLYHIICILAIHSGDPEKLALAWLLTKTDSLLVGAAKFSKIEGAAQAVKLKLS